MGCVRIIFLVLAWLALAFAAVTIEETENHNQHWQEE